MEVVYLQPGHHGGAVPLGEREALPASLLQQLVPGDKRLELKLQNRPEKRLNTAHPPGSRQQTCRMEQEEKTEEKQED